MSDNKLLNENTIRRFMQLANVDTMTDNFISEMGYGKPGTADDEKDNRGRRNEADQTDADVVEEQEEEELAPEEPEMDTEMDMEPEPEAEMEPEAELGAADMSLTEEEARLLIDLGERLSAALDEAPEAPEPEAAPDTEMDVEMGAVEDEAPADEEEEMMQEDLVQEVLKRVTKRLVAAKLQNRK